MNIRDSPIRGRENCETKYIHTTWYWLEVYASYIPFALSVGSSFVTSGWVFFPLRTIPLIYLQCFASEKKT